MANRERHLLTHLSNMEAKLRLMKDETAEYKKRLSIQKHKLFLDSLTQVHNRRPRTSGSSSNTNAGYAMAPLCLAIIDIDHFKHISRQLRPHGRRQGIEGGCQGLCRTPCATPTPSPALAVRSSWSCCRTSIRDKYQKPLENLPSDHQEHPVPLSRCQGRDHHLHRCHPVWTGDHTTDAFERADKALYSSKHSGRDQVNLA